MTSQGHTNGVTSVAFSRDGMHIVSGSIDKTVCIWDVSTGQLVGSPLQGHTSRVTSVAFSPDGMHIVSGSNDKTVCIWDVSTGQLVGSPLQGHTDGVRSVAFSPDGMHIISTSWDNFVLVLEALTGRQLPGPLDTVCTTALISYINIYMQNRAFLNLITKPTSLSPLMAGSRHSMGLMYVGFPQNFVQVVK